MRLPQPRGPVSAALCDALTGDAGQLAAGLAERFTADADLVTGGPRAVLSDDDLQLTLAICYELHYGGFEGVSDRWEWDPALLALRADGERLFEAALRALAPAAEQVEPAEIARRLVEVAAQDLGPSLARYIQRYATADQFAEFVTQRSIYHLKEADPHTWAIPRLTGRTKAALLEIQIDEYGSGHLPRMHAEMFRVTMDHLGLDSTYGAYIDDVPAITLATNNLMSYFGLHRRLRGALLGHLAAFEMTSAVPNRRYGNGLRRLGGDSTATRYYDEHVEADSVHEQIAAHDMCGSFARENPELAPDVLFGAQCCLAVDQLLADHLLACWERGETSLRRPVPAAVA